MAKVEIRVDLDSEVLRLQQMAAAGVQPQLPSLDFKVVPLASGQSALVVRVGRSYLPPHRVAFGGRNRFYVRGPGGRFEPDVDGLRALFTAAPTLGQRIRELRSERLGAIFAGETPVALHPERGVFILHVVPFLAIDSTGGQPFDTAEPERDISAYLFPGTSGLDYRVNFDGFVAHRAINDGLSYAYTQTFRSGFAEVVTAGMITLSENDSALLFIDQVAEALIWHTTKLVPLLRKRGGPSPCSILLTLAGVKGAFVAPANYRRWFMINSPLPLGRDVLSFVDVVVPEAANGSAEIGLTLKPILDQLAQAGGLREADPKWTTGLV